MRIIFLVPELLIITLIAVVLPLFGVFLERRRQRRSALVPTMRGFRAFVPRIRDLIVPTLMFMVLAVAVAQPVIEIDEQAKVVECNAQIIGIVDNTRSMLAAVNSDATTRFDRQRKIAKEIRSQFGECEWGLASFADRAVLRIPYNGTEERFVAVIDRVITINDPPPVDGDEQECTGCRTTSLEAISDVVFANFYPRRVWDKDMNEPPPRVLVVFTDGESAEFDAQNVASALRRSGIYTIFVHVWIAGEQVYFDGAPVKDYESDVASMANLEAIVRAINNLGEDPKAQLFSERDVPQIISALEDIIGNPEQKTLFTGDVRREALGPYLVPIAFILVIVFIAGLFKRIKPPRRRRMRQKQNKE